MPKNQAPAAAQAAAVNTDATEAAATAGALVEQQATESARAAADTLRLAAEAEQAAVEQAKRLAAELAEQQAEAVTAAAATAEAAVSTAAPLGEIVFSLGDGARAASREWIGWAQARALNRAAAFAALMQCRSAPEVLSLHGRLVREDIELLLATSARVCDISVAAAGQAATAVSAH